MVKMTKRTKMRGRKKKGQVEEDEEEKNVRKRSGRCV